LKFWQPLCGTFRELFLAEASFPLSWFGEERDITYSWVWIAPSSSTGASPFAVRTRDSTVPSCRNSSSLPHHGQKLIPQQTGEAMRLEKCTQSEWRRRPVYECAKPLLLQQIFTSARVALFIQPFVRNENRTDNAQGKRRRDGQPDALAERRSK
jgi:hypothetical protein